MKPFCVPEENPNTLSEVRRQKAQVLKDSLPFWDKLTTEDLELIYKNSTFVRYEKGLRIQTGDENCLGVIIITKGSLSTSMLSEEGREIVLYKLYKGDVCVLSSSCIMEPITFDVNIEVEEEMEGLVIKSSSYQKLCENNVYVDSFTYKLVAENFSSVMWAMHQILFMRFDKRLAVFLVDESARTGSNIINLTHEQIAKYTGSAREVVSRMLKRFAEDKIVSLARGEIQIINKRALMEIINA
ncbi:MAG: Crp/Fnr family transcriptional regulator [Clostridiales bacterium]|jgi:CRP/FNR family transcriptional regulator|nr:Crp/Fnr family transcriptional regulator [Clostridiales bacterium]